jgi:hypothetical protein
MSLSSSADITLAQRLDIARDGFLVDAMLSFQPDGECLSTTNIPTELIDQPKSTALIIALWSHGTIQ